MLGNQEMLEHAIRSDILQSLVSTAPPESLWSVDSVHWKYWVQIREPGKH